MAYVIKIDFAHEADIHFPNLAEDDEWEITGESDEQTKLDLKYQFVKYEKKKKKYEMEKWHPLELGVFLLEKDKMFFNF